MLLLCMVTLVLPSRVECLPSKRHRISVFTVPLPLPAPAMATDVATDEHGNVYVMGRNGEVGGKREGRWMFVAKLSKSGIVIWHEVTKGSGDHAVVGAGVAVWKGVVYVVGCERRGNEWRGFVEGREGFTGRRRWRWEGGGRMGGIGAGKEGVVVVGERRNRSGEWWVGKVGYGGVEEIGRGGMGLGWEVTGVVMGAQGMWIRISKAREGDRVIELRGGNATREWQVAVRGGGMVEWEEGVAVGGGVDEGFGVQVVGTGREWGTKVKMKGSGEGGGLARVGGRVVVVGSVGGGVGVWIARIGNGGGWRRMEAREKAMTVGGVDRDGRGVVFAGGLEGRVVVGSVGVGKGEGEEPVVDEHGKGEAAAVAVQSERPTAAAESQQQSRMVVVVVVCVLAALVVALLAGGCWCVFRIWGNKTMHA